jgi:hypothetical protein
MKTNIHFWSYLAQFFLEWEISTQNLYRNSKYTFYAQYCILENRAVYDIMWKKNCGSGQATDDNMAHAHLHAGYLRLQIYTQVV